MGPGLRPRAVGSALPRSEDPVLRPLREGPANPGAPSVSTGGLLPIPSILGRLVGGALGEDRAGVAASSEARANVVDYGGPDNLVGDTRTAV